MQGKKYYQEQLFTSFQLSEHIPPHNFYRQLKEVLDLDFLYAETRNYYGVSGQKSIDPVVFFKLCLVGYLENIISDRHIIQHSSMRLDILYFLDYEIDQSLPWHSTISRTRQLFEEGVFEEVFSKVFSMCVNKGMVSGHTQVIDAAPIKANASMESLELKVPEEDLEAYLRKVRHFSREDRKVNKATKEDQVITGNKHQLKGIVSRNKKWSKEQDGRPGAKHKKAKYTSNHTHYSPSDPDARISVKPGKTRKLNYASQLTVDSSSHVITDIFADFANKKDSQSLVQITKRVQNRLRKEHLIWRNLLADTGYSSGDNYAFLEQEGLNSYIPAHGTYKGGPEGFSYVSETDSWLCPQGKTIPYGKTYYETKNHTKKKEYRASKHICKGCPIKAICLKKSKEKRFSITYYKPEYDRAIARVKSPIGRHMKIKRSSTVEPVFGTLTQFMGLRKVFTKGIKQAQKVMFMSAIAYNLKKYLKFTKKLAESKTLIQEGVLRIINDLILSFFMRYNVLKK
ncbi:MAG: IS1182 family transposase [Aureispira sp.]|nr:IS1182 family transposase [Aureispira sp.]